MTTTHLLQIIERPQVRYCFYNGDMRKLKETMNQITNFSECEPKNVMVDCTAVKLLYSAEIGIIVATANKLRNKGKNMILLVAGKVKSILETTNINRIPNILLKNRIHIDINESGDEPASPDIPVSKQQEGDHAATP